MVRQPYFDSTGLKKGAWSKEEDNVLKAHVERFGHPNWRVLPVVAGLARCGKSCRLRWENYLKPGLKRGKFSQHEVDVVIKLLDQLGNKWSAIAANLPGRTDNEIKNYWHAHISQHRKRRGTAVAVIAEKHQQQESVSEEGLSADQSVDVLESVADHSRTFMGGFEIDPPAEEFDGFGLWQMNDMSLDFSDSSEWNNSSITDQCHGDFWSEPNEEEEEDTFYMTLW